jgi:hypothetical protein
MDEYDIEQFCWENRINKCNNSFYFTIRGRRYRVSDHSLYERSNKNKHIERCYNIVAKPERIGEIYEALKTGKKIDVRGNII